MTVYFPNILTIIQNTVYRTPFQNFDTAAFFPSIRTFTTYMPFGSNFRSSSKVLAPALTFLETPKRIVPDMS